MRQYEDRITITTPEGVDLELTLAGLGSRMAAALVDQLLQWAVILGLMFLLIVPFRAAGGHRLPILVAVFMVAVFAVHLGYHVLFETWWSGRTPAKRWMGLRVVRELGQPIAFREAVIRNVVRLVDGPVTGYVAGLVSVVASPRNQRLGDMAAGTIVVRERRGVRDTSGWTVTGLPASPEAPSWDVTAVTDEDVSTIRRFLMRRDTLRPEARARLAFELARRLRPRVEGAPDKIPPEALLEGIVSAKSNRG